MKILLDTQLLLFAAEGNVPQKAVRYIENKANILLFSSASIWEITIKSGLNRADFNVDPTALYNGLLSAGYEELPIISRHTLTVQSLPTLHKDPFDRILLAQAISEGITFITTDDILRKYPGSVIFV